MQQSIYLLRETTVIILHLNFKLNYKLLPKQLIVIISLNRLHGYVIP